MISKDLLAKYANAFIMFEIANHGVDPRETLEGTTMRLSYSEGYKYYVVRDWKKLWERYNAGEITLSDAVIKALPGYNLVDYRQKDRIEKFLDTKGQEKFSQALAILFLEGRDEEAFEKIVDVVGRYFDVLAFLYFLKDSEKYSPVRSSIFDKLFRRLGIDSELAGNCRWEKYQQYNAWVEEVQDYLCEHINMDITRIDAQTFLWILEGLEKNLEAETLAVEDVKHNKGIIVGDLNDKYITVRFGNRISSYEKDAFERGHLKFLPSRLNVYGEPVDVIMVDSATKKANNEEDEKLVSTLREMDFSASDVCPYESIAKDCPEPTFRKGISTFPRDPKIANNALLLAGCKCEIDPSHRTFIRKRNDMPYTEPHHLVPMAYQRQFDKSLDREQNIVSLCSNCHNEIHYGKDASILIRKLFDSRKEALESIGIKISFDQLQKMYE